MEELKCLRCNYCDLLGHEKRCIHMRYYFEDEKSKGKLEMLRGSCRTLLNCFEHYSGKLPLED